MAGGTIIAGFLPQSLNLGGESYPAILVIAALVVILSSLTLPKNETHSKSGNLAKEKSFFKLIMSGKTISIGLLFFGFLAGFFTSCITPYLPMILKNFGLQLEGVGFLTSISYFSSFFLTPYLAKKFTNKTKSQFLFFFSEK